MKNKLFFISAIVFLMFSIACSGENEGSDLSKEDTVNENTNDSTEDDNSDSTDDNITTNKMNIKIGDVVLTATLVENSSTAALKKALSEAPITINMSDYGNMEKVGSLGRDFPRNDESITTEAGDLILYQGSAFVIYYASNSWSFTRLGKIDNISASELKSTLGEGNVTVTLSLGE